MRTTEGKAVLDVRTSGDAELAEGLVNALSHRERTERFTHGFHTYPAGLHPDGARVLIDMFPGTSVGDPFCGGGTVLIEALAAGRRAEGIDLSPIAVRIASSRTRTPDDETLTRFRSASRRMTAIARKAEILPPKPILDAVGEWYARCALFELESLRQGLRQVDPSVREDLITVLSSVLVKVSWRQSDTSSKRQVHDRKPGTTAVLFHKKARELARRQTELREAVPPGTLSARINKADARTFRVSAPVDLIVTSPPYPGVYDYLPLQHLRAIWLGENLDPRREIGARREWRQGGREAVAAWKGDTVQWMGKAARALTPGGHLVVVVGDGLVPAGPVDARSPTEVAGREAGLKQVAVASLHRPNHARDSGRWEHVFAFRKPTSASA